MSGKRPNILVVCGRNKKRSRTAENIFKNDSRFTISSAGLSASSLRKISENDLSWANLVFVMETDQRGKVQSQFCYLQLPHIEVLNIPDVYECMDEELIELLLDKINYTLHVHFDI